MTYRLIHDSDIEALRVAVCAMRREYTTPLPRAVTDAFDKMLARNESAVTDAEAVLACRSGSMTSHFSGTLRDLYSYADNDNAARLRAAFAGIFKEYAG